LREGLYNAASIYTEVVYAQRKEPLAQARGQGNPLQKTTTDKSGAIQSGEKRILQEV